MRLAFLGTPEVAVTPLRALVEEGHDVALVVSQPDRKRGRGGALVASPVKTAASELALPVTDRVDDVVASGVELGIVVAFGKLIRPHVLDAVPMVNVHFSLLPRWRGAAPVERAVLAGDATTGVCLMALEETLDTGPIYACDEVEIGRDQTAGQLRRHLTDVGTAMLVDLLAHPLPVPVPQEGEPTYAAKIEPEERHLDWSRPAEEVERVVRIGDAWTTHRSRRLKVHRACAHEITGRGVVVPTGSGPIELLEVQPEGKPRLPAADWARGARWEEGGRLGS